MEEQGSYITEVQEALEMLGTGYDQPTVTVEPPKRTMQRRGREMVEVEEPAFVKFSTEFKAELADLDAFALKVFIYIGLSIGYETGTAWPGVRKIAKETGMNKDTVTKAIEELENKGFLKVNRREGGSNVYKPTCYFAIGDSVPRGRTVEELSGEAAKLSDETVQLSDACRVNLAQQDKQESTRHADAIIQDLSIENQIFLGKMKVTHSRADQIKNALRDYFKLTPRWASKFDREWLEWALSENVTPEQIKAAASLWGKDKRFNWAIPTLKGIAEHWLELINNPVPTVHVDGSALAALMGD